MRQRIAIGLLVFVAAWPLAHRALVARFDVNPWKLSGFAMYTTATPPVLVALMVEDPTPPATLRPLHEATLLPHTRAAIDTFRRERHALGRLVTPDAAGQAVLEARPDLDFVLVVVQRMWLNPSTALMESEKQNYLYDRAAIGDRR